MGQHMDMELVSLQVTTVLGAQVTSKACLA